jgi:hypothetical protein
MLTIFFFLTLILLVSVGNLALGFGLAIHLGHGPSNGWQALCFWNPAKPAVSEHVTESQPGH